MSNNSFYCGSKFRKMKNDKTKLADSNLENSAFKKMNDRATVWVLCHNELCIPETFKKHNMKVERITPSKIEQREMPIHKLEKEKNNPYKMSVQRIK